MFAYPRAQLKSEVERRLSLKCPVQPHNVSNCCTHTREKSRATKYICVNETTLKSHGKTSEWAKSSLLIIYFHMCSAVCNVCVSVSSCVPLLLSHVVFDELFVNAPHQFLPFMKPPHGWISAVSLLYIKKINIVMLMFVLLFCKSRHFDSISWCYELWFLHYLILSQDEGETLLKQRGEKHPGSSLKNVYCCRTKV